MTRNDMTLLNELYSRVQGPSGVDWESNIEPPKRGGALIVSEFIKTRSDLPKPPPRVLQAFEDLISSRIKGEDVKPDRLQSILSACGKEWVLAFFKWFDTV